ncbi:MAG: 2-oxoacid:acceptor oxidoreductase family protein [Blastocatellia bacterium]|nr:2-oxoacid:acceptor oxidoreductase family protein [Blastocatellia bacterium]MCS7158054.1 2-oxoacid:acceptor oxidoreductase family protein [Blastocatellia bacterium]MCX7752561.1 2-oxoacid:acceptor oxidoreductase family protein [Blastocatellia bacterium]MDW8167323.1 2-oxoacid:acceptor oxidoreductase family protein [Acidobacteriota bacterium]MDW8257351.1 2-oxoacid:acceptor oxidoreductase family protein [Acidobacteriota bacterium]
MSRWEVKIAGFGGQGIVLAGYLLGKAAAVYDRRHATMVQSYGPEARGSACVSQVIIADEPIYYPYVTEPDVVVAMSQEAYTKFAAEVKPNGLLLVERDLVALDTVRLDFARSGGNGVRLHALSATKIAEELGHRIVANIVMLGFLCALAPLVSPSGMKEALRSSLPKSAIELNLMAFDAGYERGLQVRI